MSKGLFNSKPIAIKAMTGSLSDGIAGWLISAQLSMTGVVRSLSMN